MGGVTGSATTDARSAQGDRCRNQPRRRGILRLRDATLLSDDRQHDRTCDDTLDDIKPFVITGTDTGVGKTVVTAAIAAVLRDRGRAVAVVKPVQTGVDKHAPGDIHHVSRLAVITDVRELDRFPEGLAPATAARLNGRTGVRTSAILTAIGLLADRDIVLVEGAGGSLVRLDASGGTVLDVAAALDAPVIVVVATGLGALNGAALPCEALRARGIECLGTVIGAWPLSPGLMEHCNLEDLPAYTGVPVLARVPRGAGYLHADAFLTLAEAAVKTLVDHIDGRFASCAL